MGGRRPPPGATSCMETVGRYGVTRSVGMQQASPSAQYIETKMRNLYLHCENLHALLDGLAKFGAGKNRPSWCGVRARATNTLHVRTISRAQQGGMQPSFLARSRFVHSRHTHTHTHTHAHIRVAKTEPEPSLAHEKIVTKMVVGNVLFIVEGETKPPGTRIVQAPFANKRAEGGRECGWRCAKRVEDQQAAADGWTSDWSGASAPG
ncbi:uncharacterized protein K460DRAFT_216563 [Cucurbitaria berberidis CBS 394.84]|uniref:Uncharacterized protein n=1 Tax=Cucurbitaria berberidis CBS 394.84 TaxID=1168544 RepID=A0A9P4G6W6_9PLEO|nr:uncharacterized protein K460DRAFT_216563 [Cucurbitaria berberidis CBS 394.84]KAF1840057.1 hypothetical protein K460DRAFT_216563 [Cucurbitaria berberidis CBS 394.84]